MNPVADDDGGLTRNGVIENAFLRIRGQLGTYRSNHEEDNQLGSCILTFIAKGDDIEIKQGGKCWWFGHEVNASGKYRRTLKKPEDVPHIR